MSVIGSSTQPPWTARHLATAPGPLVLVAIGLAHLGLAQVATWLNGQVATDGLTVWPAAGLALPALVLLQRERWPWALGAVALAQTAGDLAWGTSVGAALGSALGSTTEAVVGALLLRRLGNPAGSWVPVRHLLRVVLAGALVAPACGASLASAVSASAGSGDFADLWWSHFVSHALGVLVLAPVLLAAGSGPTWSSRAVPAADTSP